jgi:hypothetical protein
MTKIYLLGGTLLRLSQLLRIPSSVIPNIITFIVVVILILTSIKGALEFKSIIIVYFISMTVLSLLGINSIFNLITILGTVIDAVIDLIF